MAVPGNRVGSRSVQLNVKFARLGVAIVIGSAVVAACGSGDHKTTSTTREPPTSSSTAMDQSSPISAADSRATVPRSATTLPSPHTAASVRATCEAVDQLQVGEQGCVDVLDGAVYLGDGLFLADQPVVPYPGREWRRSDFPKHWDVTILNEAPTDGENWIIHDVIATRVDEDTLRITDVDERFIADLIRDDTPIDERIVAG